MIDNPQKLFYDFIQKQPGGINHDRFMVLPKNQTPKAVKRDFVAPESLLRSAFLHNQMDVPAAVQTSRRTDLHE